MIDISLPYCTYRTTHPKGFIYEGKGITSKVASGTYQGSGIRFKLALTLPGYEKDTWTTIILETFQTEEEAFTAEAALVPLTSLADPYRLNMHVGGANGKYQTPARLLQKYASEKKAITKKARSDKAKAKVAALKKRIKELK
jgi:hypothetical protein